MRVLILALLAACAPDAEPDATSEVMVVRKLSFEPIVDGTTRGFDLDAAVDQCGVVDYTHPDGTGGIDNSFAALLPALNAVGGDALPELVQASVTAGELLLLLELQPADDEGCRRLDIWRGRGQPEIGSDNLILPDQTFDIDATQPFSTVDCSNADADGGVSGGGYTMRLPLTVFDESIDLTLKGGEMRMEPAVDGIAQGVISGGVETANLQANVASFDGIPQAIHDLFGTALEVNADLVPDETGGCTQLSVVLSFEAVPAFLFDDAVRPAL